MYKLIYMIPVLIAIVISAILWNKKNNQKQIISIMICGLIGAAIISFFPIENLFVSFESPEKAAYYVQNRSVLQVAEGKESAAILYESDETSSLRMFVKKHEKGYQLTSLFGAEELSVMYHNGAFISLLRVKGTDDYYLHYYSTVDQGTKLEIHDSASTKFDFVITDLSNNKMNIDFIVCIPYTPEYTLYVDNVPITFDVSFR